MLKVKPFLFILFLTVFVALLSTGCSNDSSSSMGGGNLTPTVTKVSVDKDKVTLGLAENQTHQIIVTITPGNAENKDVTYSSSDETVAVVSETGLITPKKIGNAVITVTSVDNHAAKASVNVDVIANNPSSGNSGDTGTDIKWDNLPSSPITGSTVVFDEELPEPDTPVTPENVLALIGHYRIQYMTVSAPDGSKIVDNIVGTGNNMRGEIAVNAVSCEQNPVSCPVGLTIKMQYKSQFHPDIVSQNIPYSIEFIRKDIYSPLTSITDIPGEFAKLGAEIVEDTNKSGEFVVKFTLNSPDLPMPKGYTMQVTLKKIADDTLLDGGINIDNSRYFSTGGSTGPVKVTGVTVNNKNIGIEIGKTAKLNYTITPLDADNKAVIFATYDNKVAEIGLDGTITAVGIGETEVEVRTVDGSFTDKAKVIVVDKLVSVEGITAGTDTVTLDINLDPSKASKTADVKFQVTPANATNKQILLKDGYNRNLIDAKIVNGEDGVATLSISAKFSTGTTNVTVYADNDHSIEKTVKVTVNDTTIHPASVSINENNVTMTAGDTKQLTAVVMPESAFMKNVKWSSNDISVVKVDENTGMLTAVGAGSAAITVTTVDGNHIASCEVTVEAKYVPVTKVSFDTDEAVFAQDAANISVVANISPSDATNKGVTYSSSSPEKVSVDINTGALTIKDINASQDYQVTITATSNDNSGLKDTIIVKITSNFEAVTKVTITNKTPAELKIGDTYTPIYKVEPSNATNAHVIISVDDNKVLSYSAETKTFTAVKEGIATITVKSESNQNVYDTFQVKVWEPADITGKYDVYSLAIYYNGKVIKSSENQRGTCSSDYYLDHKYFAVSTKDNLLDITGKIHVRWSQFIQDSDLDQLRYRYFSLNETLSDRDNSKDKLAGKGFTFNSDGSLTYEFPFVLGVDDTLKYSAGSSNKLVFVLNNKYPYQAIEQGQMETLTPICFEDDNSFEGTYDIVFFGTKSNGSSLADAVIQTNCDIYKSLWAVSSCPSSGAFNGNCQIQDNEFAGRAVIKVVNGELKVHTKVAMLYTKMGSMAAGKAANDRYQYTVYADRTLSSWQNTGLTGKMTGRNVSEPTDVEATYYFEKDKSFNDKSNLDIILFSNFSGTKAGMAVKPDTRLILRKIDKEVIPMNPNSLTEEPFNKINLTLGSVSYTAPSLD